MTNAVIFDHGEDLITLLKNGIECAHRKNDRPLLSGILISGTSEAVRLVSTDSYMLLTQDYSKVQGDGFDPMVLDLNDAKSWVKAINKLAAATVEYVPDDFSGRLTLTSAGAVVTTVCTPGTYPNYEMLIPSSNQYGDYERSTFDGSKLGVLHNINAPGLSTKSGVEKRTLWSVEVLNHTKPGVFTADTPEWHARLVVMPVCVSNQ